MPNFSPSDLFLMEGLFLLSSQIYKDWRDWCPVLIIYCSLLQCNISLFKQKIIEIKYFILRQGVDVPKLYKKYAYSDLQKYTLTNYLSGFCCAVSVGIILSYNL